MKNYVIRYKCFHNHNGVEYIRAKNEEEARELFERKMNVEKTLSSQILSMKEYIPIRFYSEKDIADLERRKRMNKKPCVKRRTFKAKGEK